MLTKECEGDARRLCAGSSFALGMFNQSSKCAKAIISGAMQQQLTPKCIGSDTCNNLNFYANDIDLVTT